MELYKLFVKVTRPKTTIQVTYSDAQSNMKLVSIFVSAQYSFACDTSI
jgi:type IV secretory pathway VirB3-like protein